MPINYNLEYRIDHLRDNKMEYHDEECHVEFQKFNNIYYILSTFISA